MDRLRRLQSIVVLWYHNLFWNLHSETKTHPSIELIPLIKKKALQLHAYVSQFFLKYYHEFQSEWTELTSQPQTTIANKRLVIPDKNTHKSQRVIKKIPQNTYSNNSGKQTTKRKKTHILYSLNSLKRVFGFRIILYEYMYPTNRVLFSWYAHLLYSILVISIGLVGTGQFIYIYAFLDLPPVSDLVERKQRMTTRILDRNGELLFRIYEDENRTLISLDELPDHVVNATIAIEDKNYYQHLGFSVGGIIRAFIANSQNESIQGGSTITQQLVKNRLLSPERTLQRKVREFILAIQVNAAFTKNEVLEMYFNQVAYGGTTYGIEEAAQLYFGKSARYLTLAEAAMLAGLPAAPSIYSPFGSRPELAFVRQEEVLRRMVEDEHITPAQAESARSEILIFRPNTINIQAPHFVMFVRELLAQQYGEQVVNQDGLEVITSLDLSLQNQVQELVAQEVAGLHSLRVSNGAALVTQPKTGEITAMVGSINYFNFEQEGQVNVTMRPRQPGSAIKPLTYALALSKGKTPHSIIDDSPITYQILGSRPYTPRNYDGRFRGRVTLREALASSYNIPAVKLLAEFGTTALIDFAEQMGISTWQDRSRFGLSLTLGGGEVLMTDMAVAYGTFANYGFTTPLNPILEVKNAYGESIYRNTCALDGYGCSHTRSLDPRIAYQITDILSDNRARTPAFGPQSVLHIPGHQVAVKTGTTNSLRDNWTFGYTTEHVVSTWVGNNDNTSMSYVASGITGASPLWNNIMRLLLDQREEHIFPLPDGMITVPICVQTGTVSCRECPTTIQEVFIPGTEPTIACSAASFQSSNANIQDGQYSPENLHSSQNTPLGEILDGWSSN